MTYVPRLFCACGQEMKIKTTGTVLEVRLQDQEDRPYYKISSDEYECVDCGRAAFLNASHPIAHVNNENFPKFETKYIMRLRG